MQHVSGKVERESLLEPDDRTEVVGLACRREFLERGVHTVDVGLVVLVVVKLEHACRVVRFERGVVVVERGELVRLHHSSKI